VWSYAVWSYAVWSYAVYSCEVIPCRAMCTATEFMNHDERLDNDYNDEASS
jgi:hypothetical protein